MSSARRRRRRVDEVSTSKSRQVEVADAVLHGFEVRVDGGERCAHLVREISEHPAPRDVCGLEPVGKGL